MTVKKPRFFFFSNETYTPLLTNFQTSSCVFFCQFVNLVKIHGV